MSVILWKSVRSRGIRGRLALVVFAAVVLCGWWCVSFLQLRHKAKKPAKRAPRSKFERDPVALLKQLPPDPLLSKGKRRVSPAALQNLKVSIYNGPLLITAPHGIPLWRAGKLKGNEPATSLVAWRSAFMDPLRGFATALTWRDISITAELSKSQQKEKQRILDPNYLLPQETQREPWSLVMRAHFRQYGDNAVLLDIHGMADDHGSDCTIGIAPWKTVDEKSAVACQECLHARLRTMFPSLRFKQLPLFTGDWNDKSSPKYSSANAGRMTLSRQAVHLGMRAVQMEMTMRLRRSILGLNETDTSTPIVVTNYFKLHEFANALRVCILHLDPVAVPTVPMTSLEPS